MHARMRARAVQFRVLPRALRLPSLHVTPNEFRVAVAGSGSPVAIAQFGLLWLALAGID